MISTNRASPGRERCDRPSNAPASASGDQPGRLAQGPDEKQGLAGRRVGFIAASFPFGCGPTMGPAVVAGPLPLPTVTVNAAAQHEQQASGRATRRRPGRRISRPGFRREGYSVTLSQKTARPADHGRQALRTWSSIARPEAVNAEWVG